MRVSPTRSENIKRALSDPAVRAKMSAASKRRWTDPSTRARFIAARGGSKKRKAICARCDVTFEKYNTKKAVRDYCSVACQRADRAGERNPKWRGGTVVTLACRHCSKSFQIQRAGTKKNRGQFCSIECKAAGTRIHATKAAQRRAASRRRETRQRAARAINHHTEAEWMALLAKHGGCCARCRSTDRIERDHIIPMSKEGDDSIENIQPLCKRCNCRKWNKLEAVA